MFIYKLEFKMSIQSTAPLSLQRQLDFGQVKTDWKQTDVYKQRSCLNSQQTRSIEGQLLRHLTLPVTWPKSCTSTHLNDYSQELTSVYVLRLPERK